MKKRHSYGMDYEVQEEEVQGRFGRKVKRKLVYHGTYYQIEEDKTQTKKRKILAILYAVFLTVIYSGLGSLNNGGSREIYVLMPFILMFLPIYYLWLGTIRQFRNQEKMTKIELEHSTERIRRSLMGIMVLSIGGALGQAVFLIQRQKTNHIGKEYLFLTGLILIIVSTQIMIQTCKRLKITEI